MRWGVVVMAAGQGTRMLSARPKVLHELAGRPLLDHVLDAAAAAAVPDACVVVVGHGAGRVVELVEGRAMRHTLQEPQLGTGDALRVGLRALPVGPEGVLVLSGDVPLLRPQTLAALRDQVEAGAAAAMLTARLDQPGAYGRVLRGDDGSVRGVVEARDAGPDELAVGEVNAGVYAFRRDGVERALAALGTDNAQGEYYLTDAIAELVGRGERVAAVVLEDATEMAGVNTRGDLAAVARLLNRRVLEAMMDAGVTVLDPATTWIEPGCRVERDVVLEPGVVLRGGTTVGGGARVGAHSVLDGATVARGEAIPPLTRFP